MGSVFGDDYADTAIEDPDDMAHSDLVLCAGGNGLSVVLPHSHPVGQHVHRSERAIPRKPVSLPAATHFTMMASLLTLRGSGFGEFWLSVVGTWIGVGGLLFVRLHYLFRSPANPESSSLTRTSCSS
jgi:hypothetical protein